MFFRLTRNSPAGKLMAGIVLPNKGVTFVELMVSITVLVVMLAVGVPGILQMKRSNELLTTVNAVVSALTYAKGEAIKRGVSVKLAPVDGDWAKGWSVDLDGGESLREFKAPSSDATVAATQASVVYRYMGNVTDATCFDIHVPGGSGSNIERSVDINAMGRILSCHASCDDVAGDQSLCR
ncbi:GspH/FimT family pseudopilin [Solemya velesiana gill symbiont]|uniref:Type II secretion system protein H n=1 Tax=Solemya velesiana gill symbiont TaxID=1918948 RepID=A0A1T2KQ30_9GAMM|nr:GspH/FimT family pseudopilin [Solemya velesiana gill symbiont]OOZ34947.1 hypothetical protein BOW51_11730 [Solemya velesiana gill symbiont]